MSIYLLFYKTSLVFTSIFLNYHQKHHAYWLFNFLNQHFIKNISTICLKKDDASYQFRVLLKKIT